MAVELKKVLDAIELKFKGKSITKDFKKALATKWADKIDNDTDIDKFIEDREDVILEASAEGDRRATAAGKAGKEEVIKKVTGKEPEIIEDEPTDDMGKLMKMVTGLVTEISTLKAEKTTASLADKFTNDERLKGISPTLLKKWAPTSAISDEDLDALIEQTAVELKDFVKVEKQDAKATGFGGKQSFERPGSLTNGVVVSTDVKEVPDAVKNLIAKTNEQAKAGKASGSQTQIIS